MRRIIVLWKRIVLWVFFAYPVTRRFICKAFHLFSPNSILGLIGEVRYSPSGEVRKRAIRKLEAEGMVDKLCLYFGLRDIPLLGQAILLYEDLGPELQSFTPIVRILICKEKFLTGSRDEFERLANLILGNDRSHKNRDTLASSLREYLNTSETVILVRISNIQLPVSSDAADTDLEISVVQD